jgi:hypothetical protein
LLFFPVIFFSQVLSDSRVGSHHNARNHYSDSRGPYKESIVVDLTAVKSYSLDTDNDGESDDEELFQAHSKVKVFPTETGSKLKPTSRAVGKNKAPKSYMDIENSDESDDGEPFQSKTSTVGDERKPMHIASSMGNCDDSDESDDDKPPSSGSKSMPRGVGKNTLKPYMDCEGSDKSDDGEPFHSKASSSVGDERKPMSSASGMDSCDDSSESDDDKPPSSESKLKPRGVGKNKAPKAYMDFESSDESDDGEPFQSKASTVGDERKHMPIASGMDSCDDSDDSDESPSKTKFKASVDLTGGSDLYRTPKARRSVAKKDVTFRAPSMDVDSDDIGDEELSDDEPSKDCRGKSFASLEKAARLGKDAEFSEPSEDDTDDELSTGEEYTRTPLRIKTFPSSLRLIPSLSPGKMDAILETVKEAKDKALQRLLLGAGFQFTLLPHQFLAVRKIAGVPNDFPMHLGSNIRSPKIAVMCSALKGLDYQANNQTNKGILIADEMVRALCANHLSCHVHVRK